MPAHTHTRAHNEGMGAGATGAGAVLAGGGGGWQSTDLRRRGRTQALRDFSEVADHFRSSIVFCADGSRLRRAPLFVHHQNKSGGCAAIGVVSLQV